MPTGDPSGWFESLYGNNHMAILRYAQRRLANDTAAWDVVSETFLAAWRIRDKCPATPGRDVAWLYAIARNAVRNQQRSGVRSMRLVAAAAVVGGPPSAPDVADEVAERDVAMAALEQMSEDDREVLRLVVWEGLGPAELATALDISASAAKVRLHRARLRLEQMLSASPDLSGEDHSGASSNSMRF